MFVSIALMKWSPQYSPSGSDAKDLAILGGRDKGRDIESILSTIDLTKFGSEESYKLEYRIGESH